MTPARWAITAGCAYEIVAVSTDRVPTITAIVQRSSRYRFGRVLMALWLAIWIDHFIDRTTT